MISRPAKVFISDYFHEQSVISETIFLSLVVLQQEHDMCFHCCHQGAISAWKHNTDETTHPGFAFIKDLLRQINDIISCHLAEHSHKNVFHECMFCGHNKTDII